MQVSIGSCIHGSASNDSLKERYEEYIQTKRDSYSRACFAGFTGLDGNPVVSSFAPNPTVGGVTLTLCIFP
jgi:hypothetical protein